MRRRGMALSEVIVSSGVLLMLLGLVTLAVVAYLRGTYQLLAQPFSADAVSRGLERCGRALRSTQALVHPTRAELLTGYRPELPARPPLVLKLRTPAGTFQTVGLSLDPARQKLLQVLYPGAYDASEPYPTSARRLELGPATGLLVLLGEPDLLTIRLEAGGQQLPWSAGAHWNGVAFP